MNRLPIIDICVIVIYLIFMILIGVWISRKNKNVAQFTKASGKISGWVIGLSIYATYLSSNTFIGIPGKAFGGNWNAFAFSLAMPLSAWVAVRYFVPFYRKIGGISAYSNLEYRFGPWARTYAVICFLLIQLARMGSIFFGVALTLRALTGYNMALIMIIIGACTIVYTVLGGIEAVIWTDVVQAIVITIGAIVVFFLVIAKMPDGITKIVEIGINEHKFSLGSFKLDFTTSSFWVVFLYGFFMNLKAFGFDQNYVQRYHSARSAKDAAKSLWLCIKLYVPISLFFFIIGSCLYAYYQVSPEAISGIKRQTAIGMLPMNASNAQIIHLSNTLKPQDYGDKVLPHFIVTMLPVGIIGLIIAAILSAAMSTISSGMNASATIFFEDIYKRYFKPRSSEKHKLNFLYIATSVFGILGMFSGIALIGVKSILDVWWELSGIFAGGMFGLFLLSLFSRQTKSSEAFWAVIVGILVIIWMSLSYLLPPKLAFFRSSMHTNMIIVIGTIAIYLTGILLPKVKYLMVKKE